MGRLFIFIGPPGAGKGSLSQFCIQRFGWKQLSTGALCRKHIIEQTEIGKQIDFAIKSGKLIPDDLMTSLVEEWLIEHNGHYDSIILDGFPRTVKQAELLTQVLRSRLNHCHLSVVKLSVPDAVVVQRLGGRTVCYNKDCQAVYSAFAGSPLSPKESMKCDVCLGVLVRRSDDESSSVQERLRVYHAQANQLVDFYIQANVVVHELDVERVPHQIFEDFERLIECGRHDYDKK